jgi:hypothetical protein
VAQENGVPAEYARIVKQGIRVTVIVELCAPPTLSPPEVLVLVQRAPKTKHRQQVLAVVRHAPKAKYAQQVLPLVGAREVWYYRVAHV